MNSCFQKETARVLADWDGTIKMRSVRSNLNLRELLEPLPCGDDFVPLCFRWNGSSSGIFQFGWVFNFPRWKHPIASCRHDWRCAIAKNKEERKIADELFREDIGIGGTKWEQLKGYWGVRLGALLGIGNNF